MNCREINSLLDSDAPDALAPEARQAVDRHLASCRACRESWAIYRAIADAPVPRMPRQLGARIAAAVAARGAAETRRARGWIGIGAVLVVGAALAATAVVQLGERAPETDAASRALDVVPAAPTPSARAAAAETSSEAAANVAVQALERAVAPRASTVTLDAQSIVVAAVPDPAVDARVAAEFAKCHEEIVRALRSVSGLNVIADERIAAFAAAGFAEEEIARELGAGSVLVLKIMNREASCSATQRDARTGEQIGISAMTFVGPRWTDEGWRSFATQVAEIVENETLKDRSTVIAEAQATALNTALDERARLNAMIELFHATEPPQGPFDAGVVAAAVQIGSSSRDAGTREYAWYTLRGVDDPYVIQPLLHALLNDPAENVRRAAALTLGHFVDVPGVRDGLVRAATSDPSPEVAATCCTPTVREAARYALRPDAERRAFALQTVLDTSLPAEERLRPFNSSIDGRDVPLDEAAARAVFALGLAEADASARSSAWHLLAQVRNPDFKPTLLEDLASHPAENVRSGAAWALARYGDDPVVRAALERAQNDASRSVQRVAREALERASASR
jgi:HEAT repeat protein